MKRAAAEACGPVTLEQWDALDKVDALTEQLLRRCGVAALRRCGVAALRRCGAAALMML